MTTPNQITVVASATRQGIYTPTVRMYNAEAGRYGLLPKDYYFKGKTRDRKLAVSRGREIVKQIKNMTADDQRAWLEENNISTCG